MQEPGKMSQHYLRATSHLMMCVCQAEDVSGETLKRKRMSGRLGATVGGAADSWFPLRS